MSNESRPNKAITLTVTCIGSFMLLLDTSIVTLALPKIQVDLHTNLVALQWIVDAYILPFAVLMLTGGTLGDRFGRKRLFLSGLTLFVIGSLISGFAPSLGWLLLGRATQGVGAAALSPGSLSVLAAAFPEPKSRAQAIGAWGGISGIGLAIGPLLGGVLAQFWGWPAIFFVNVPIGLVALILAWPGLSESRNPEARHIDMPGQLLVIAGLACLVVAIIQGASLGWTSPLILGLFAGAVVFLAVFLFVETRVGEPLLPLQLFGIRVFSLTNLVALVVGFTALSTIFFMAQYFQQVQGYSVLVAGLCTFPISMGAFLMAPLAGGIAGKIGFRVPITLGALLTGGAILLLALFLAPNTAYGSLWWILAILGLGLGLILSPAQAAVFSVTPPKRTGLGASMYTTSNEMGNTLGVAIIGALVLQQFAGNIASQLTQRGVSASASTTIAQTIAGAGANAGQAPISGRLPLPLAVMHQAISQAFVNSLHGAFLISAICLLVIAVLVALFFKQSPAQTGADGSDAPESMAEPVAINAQKR